ncbi:MAG: phage major capsid protein, partial [Pseudonocardia sp.]|nr:phage major capsid protein [Pseudonocardia sp.]
RLGNARWVMSDQMLALIRKLKDSQGHPLYNPVPVSGEPATINGRPYSIDLGIAAPGPNAVSLLFGDVKRGYTIRQVHHVQMVALHERYADQLASGFFAYSRLDAAPNDAKAKAVTISSLSAYTCREVVRPMKMSRRRRSAGHSTTARACKPTATRNDQ